MSGINNLFIGAENAESFFIGSQECELIYLGNEIVYQKGDFEGIRMKNAVALGKDSGSTYDLKIKSSEPWTLSVDTAVTWLEFSQLTGDSGQTIVTIECNEENQTGSDRSTTITATTANYSATCVVKQISVHYVYSIYTQSMSWDSSKYIDTMVTATTATTMRIGYVGANIGSDRVIGYDWMDTGVYDQGWRYFNGYNDTNTVDFINSRKQGGSPTRQSGVEYDITLGNNYLYDNINESYLVAQGDVKTALTMQHSILVDVGSQKVKFVKIWDGQTLVFDGQAAIDEWNNIFGLYDSVSNTWKYNPNIQMTYEGNINMDLFSANEPQTEEYIIIDGITYYKYDKSLGYYEMYSNEKVIGYLSQRYNGGQICVLKDVDNNSSYSLISNYTNIEIYQGSSLLTSLQSGSNTIINGMKITNHLGTSSKQIYFETTNAMWEIRQIA